MRLSGPALACLVPALLAAQDPAPLKPGAFAAPGCSFEASEQLVRPGGSVLLRWDGGPGPGKVRLDPGGLVLERKGQVTVRPTGSTTYSLFEAAAGGGLLGRLEIRVDTTAPLGEPARVCAFTSSTSAVVAGEPVVLRWTCTGTAKVRLEPGGLELDGQSEITVTPLENTRYTLTATNLAGGGTRSLDVTVLRHPVQGNPAKVCTFTASRTAIRPGEPVELRWECQGDDAKVRLQPGNLELDGKSAVMVIPDGTTVYTLSVSNLAGGETRSVEVQVIPGLPDPAPAPAPIVVAAPAAAPIAAVPAPVPPPVAAPVPAPVAAQIPAATDVAAKVEAWKGGNLPLSLVLGQAQRAASTPDAWTLRLVVSGSAEGLKLLAKHGAKEAPELMVLPYVRRDGFRWWQACLGAFPTRAEALKAMARLSPALRKALSEPLALKLDRLPGDPPRG
jgi:septal ring-binding cell division protein DamX